MTTVEETKPEQATADVPARDEPDAANDAELPPNFKNWGAVLDSYKASQKKLHSLAQENAVLRAQLEQASPDPDAFREAFAEHRAAARAEIAELLALEARLANAETAALRRGGA